ncbi:(S)-N-methylcoclaurine 3'-hydroxylase isozyme 1 (Fragment) [Linum grandiflorum]
MAIYLLLLPFITIIISVIFITTSKTRPPSPQLPPGPKPWPIIGNLLHLTKKNHHVSLQSLSKLYGPLISFRLGSHLLIVASTPAAAAEILKTHDHVLSGRYVPKAIPWETPDLDRKTIMWASSCHENWKSFKTLFKTRLFSSKAMEYQSAVRERKTAEMVDFVWSRVGEEIDIGTVVCAFILSSMFQLMFSIEFVGFEATEELQSLVRKLLELVAAPNVVDVFPILEKLDPQGLRRATLRGSKELSLVWKANVNERRESLRRGGRAAAGETEDFLDVFLEIGLDDEQIDWLGQDLLVGGTDTVTATIEWAMAELMRNGGVMKKLREELKTEFSNGKPLKESDIYRLPYLTAIVKETLRLHPPAPLLGLHRALETIKVMDYTIPEGALVTANVWAIARDCSIWGDDAESFKPERFMGSKVDFRGQDFELLPFGSGNRVCPGIPSAARQLPLLLANLVWNFDWCLPDIVNSAAELDMKEKFGLSLHKEQPLVLVPRPSSILQD